MYNFDPKTDAWGPTKEIKNVSIGAQPKVNTENVKVSLTNGQAWGFDPISTQVASDYEPLWDSDQTDYNAPLRPELLWLGPNDGPPVTTSKVLEGYSTSPGDGKPYPDGPLWDSEGTAWRPVDDLAGNKTGDNLSQWGSEFDNLPQSDPSLDTSGLSGQSALAVSGTSGAGKLTPGSAMPPTPPTPPSTRPYIWKYQ